jgi:hypothetical protein
MFRQDTVSVPANGSVKNAVVGTSVETFTSVMALSIAVAAEAAGIRATIKSGTDELQEDSPVPVLAAGIFPKLPDDYYLQDVILPGERLTIRFDNTTGGAVVAKWGVQAVEMGG